MRSAKKITVVGLLCFASSILSEEAGSNPPETEKAPLSTSSLTVDELINLYDMEEVERILQAIENIEPTHLIEQRGTSLLVEGDISEAMYLDLRRYVQNSSIERFIVNSPGGEVSAGLSIAKLMLDHNISLEVDGICASSCANYLFVAADEKVIRDGSAVIWHGNTSQKDWREFELCGRTVSSLSGLPIASQNKLGELAAPHARAYRQNLYAREREFYALVGVDEFIARIGQEPEYHGNFTMKITDMAKFGVENVQAPPSYGTQTFCEDFGAKHPGSATVCLEVTSYLIEHEMNRRIYGEVCNENGLLVTVNSAIQ